MKPDSILVLGAGGFIGRHITMRLAESGIPVIAATRAPVGFMHAGVRNVVAPFVDPTSFTKLLEESRAVVHAASLSTPGSSMATPQLDGNLRTILALLEALQSFPDRRLLFLSSAGTLYGNRDTTARETDPLRPRSYHGAGKAAAEQFIHAWAAQYEGTAVVLRPSNVYGEGQIAKKGFAIVPTAMECAINGQPLSILGDGLQVRDYLHVKDLIELCTRALNHPFQAGSHVFNAASGEAITLNNLLAQIEAVTERKIARENQPPRPADVKTVLVDPNAANEVLGWRASVTLDDGLASTWAWHQGRR